MRPARRRLLEVVVRRGIVLHALFAVAVLVLVVGTALVSRRFVVEADSVSLSRPTLLGDFAGVNVVVNNNPEDVTRVAGWARDYHKWYWYEEQKDVYTWSGGWQKLDWFYSTLSTLGVKVMPDVEFAPGWASSNGARDGVPDPVEHAEYLGELTRHYGNAIVAVENYNEPNQWWQAVRFPAGQFGAMTAQDYAAVKAANPKTTFVLAGMAGPDTAYLDGVVQAGGKFDVLNFHWYAQGDTVNGGKNPESGGLFESIDKMKAWRDANAPGRPIWITEFGWDTFAQADGRKSNIYAPESSAANYLLRALVLMQGRGIEKGFVFLYRDVSDNATYLHNLYLSSGLVTNVGEKDARKKASWYYLATLKNVLGEYAFDRIVSDGPNIYHYEYFMPGSNKRAAVLWAREGERDNGYRVDYRGPEGTLVVPAEGSTTGTVEATDGNLTLAERPVFVLYDAAPEPTATPTDQPTSTSTPSPTITPSKTSTPTSLPSRTVAPPSGGPLADAPWPTYAQNVNHNNRSPYYGPTSTPRLRWSFNRSGDHWGTDYQGTGIGMDNTVYLGAGMAGVYAIDSQSGQMKWLFSPETTGHETWVEFPPTVASDGTLYITSENDYLYALSPDGKVLWKFRADHMQTPVSISPDGSSVHFVSENGNVYALNRADGRLKWSYRLGYGAYGTGRRIPVVYDARGNLYFGWLNTVWSLTPDGVKRWSEAVSGTYRYVSGPAVGPDGTMHFINGARLTAVSREGQVKWTYTLPASAFDRTPAIGPDGIVYIGDEHGYLNALNPDGTLAWRERYVTVTGWGAGIKSDVTMDAAGNLYFYGRDGVVYGVSSQTREVLWRYPTGQIHAAYPGLGIALDSDGTLYVPVDEHLLLALEPVSVEETPTPIPPSRTPTSTPIPTPIPPSSTPAPSPTPTPTPTAPAGGVLWGAWVGKSVNVAGDEAAFEEAIGKPRAIRHWYWSVAPLSGDAANFAAWSKTMPDGATLMLSFSPSYGANSTLDNVNAGKHDAYMAEWAKALKAYGKEVLLRPMWEDNGGWYWWRSGGDWDKARKEKYKLAFRRIVDTFRAEGASNVKFVWSPNVWGSGAGNPMLSYPGDAYVDWIGLDGYPFVGGRGDFYRTFKVDYDALKGLGKPLMVAETGISIWSDAKRAEYVRNLLEYELPVRFPAFEAFVWFNEPPWGELMDSRYPLTLEAFRKGISGSYYQGRGGGAELGS